MAGREQGRLLSFEVEETEEPLIARGGLALVYEVARALKIPQVVDRELPAPGSGRGYRPSAFVMPLLLMFHGGGRKLEDLRELRGEVSLRQLLGMEELPASCTVGDWLRRMGEKGLAGLGRVSQHLIAEVLSRDKDGDYTLDVDGTILETEKEGAQWTYKKVKGYQPLMGFLWGKGVVLHKEFREGNVPPGAGAVGFLEECRKRMPPGKGINYLRSDSAFYQAGVMNWCFEHKVLFTITADQDRGVKEAVRVIKPGGWQPYERDREIGETVYTMEHTRQAFRLVVQRWPKAQGDLFDPDPYCYHVIATNREEEAREIVSLHDQRGEVENYIKELKSGFGLEGMPCGESQANAVFFRIGVLAYNLFLALKLLALPSWWRRHTIATLRWRLYQVAARVVSHAHRIILKLAASLDKVRLFRQVQHRCWQIAYG